MAQRQVTLARQKSLNSSSTFPLDLSEARQFLLTKLRHSLLEKPEQRAFLKETNLSMQERTKRLGQLAKWISNKLVSHLQKRYGKQLEPSGELIEAAASNSANIALQALQ